MLYAARGWKSLNAFDGHPDQLSVNWKCYEEVTELQEQRLYEELFKPHNHPGNPAYNVNDLMNDILS